MHYRTAVAGKYAARPRANASWYNGRRERRPSPPARTTCSARRSACACSAAGACAASARPRSRASTTAWPAWPGLAREGGRERSARGADSPRPPTRRRAVYLVLLSLAMWALLQVLLPGGLSAAWHADRSCARSVPLEIWTARCSRAARRRSRCCARWSGGAPLALLRCSRSITSSASRACARCGRCSRCCSCSRSGCARLLLSGVRAHYALGDRGRAAGRRCMRRARSTYLSTASVVGRRAVGVAVAAVAAGAAVAVGGGGGAAVARAARRGRAVVAGARELRARARPRGVRSGVRRHAGMRGVFLIVEMLALFGTIGLFANLCACS